MEIHQNIELVETFFVGVLSICMTDVAKNY